MVQPPYIYIYIYIYIYCWLGIYVCVYLYIYIYIYIYNPPTNIYIYIYVYSLSMVFVLTKPRRNRVYALFDMQWCFQFYQQETQGHKLMPNAACVGSVNELTQPYATHANGHLHIYFFKEYRTRLLRKQLYLYILFSFLLLFNCVDFLPSLDFIWPFDSTPRNTQTFIPVLLQLFLLLLCQFKTKFFLSPPKLRPWHFQFRRLVLCLICRLLTSICRRFV